MLLDLNKLDSDLLSFHAVMVFGLDFKVPLKVALNLLLLIGLHGPVTQILKSWASMPVCMRVFRLPQ